MPQIAIRVHLLILSEITFTNWGLSRIATIFKRIS